MAVEDPVRSGDLDVPQRITRSKTHLIRKISGVVNASVNLATEKADITYLPATSDPSRVVQTIRDVGYTPEQADGDTKASVVNEHAIVPNEVRFALVFALPLVIVSMGPMLIPGLAGLKSTLLPHSSWGLIELLLATPVQFWAGRRFY